jgi:hypothetical protein
VAAMTRLASTRRGATKRAIWVLEPTAIESARSIRLRAAMRIAVDCSAELPMHPVGTSTRSPRAVLALTRDLAPDGDHTASPGLGSRQGSIRTRGGYPPRTTFFTTIAVMPARAALASGDASKPLSALGPAAWVAGTALSPPPPRMSRSLPGV